MSCPRYAGSSATPGPNIDDTGGHYVYHAAMRTFLAAIIVLLTAWGTHADEGSRLNLVLSCSPENDVYRLLCEKDPTLIRFDHPADAVANAPSGAGVLVLADGYPDNTTDVDSKLYAAAADKGLRLYVEYPSRLPNLHVGRPSTMRWGRAVVASDAFGDALKRLRILAIHGCQFVPVNATRADIVMARVAGFDTAVYGLPEETHPILFEHDQGNLLVATTKLSQCITARYAPSEAWREIWATILEWASPGNKDLDLSWTPTVRPSFNRDEAIPSGAELLAQHRGAQWFFNAKLFPETPVPHATGDPSAHQTAAPEYGKHGVLEGFSSDVRPDGSQPILGSVRNDCMGESTMALAFDAVLSRDDRSRQTALNLGSFIFFDSEITKGERGDPVSAAYGLMGWTNHQSLGVFYGDDNARSMLGTLTGAALLGVDQWDEKILRCLLANLRTTGPQGFRGRRLEQKELIENGWQFYYERPLTHFAPHYEAYLWACFLWAYHQTGFEPFLERTKTALRMTMQAYPDEWKWTNGLQQERARMLLPLAWLVRIEDTPEHRQWLRRIADGLLALQDPCGAIREELGPAGLGSYEPPDSNEAYGTNEAPLIQENSDALCDLLYTTNFAFLGLHEAAATTGDPYYRQAEDRLAEFLCRVQIRSEAHPELDGGWFRAFDFERWEYWASDADLGWGAWSIESGWTCGWITSVFGMRHLNSSLWDITAESTIERHFPELRAVMVGDAPGMD